MGDSKRGSAGRARTAPRLVVFSSWRARLVRVALGIAALVGTWLLVGPAVTDEHPPPNPTTAYLTPLPKSHTEPDEAVVASINAPSCRNPAHVEIAFHLPASAWTASSFSTAKFEFDGPTIAHVAAEALSQPDAAAEHLHPTTTIDPIPLNGGSDERETEVTLPIPAWRRNHSDVQLTFIADLVHPQSYHRCYVSYPAVGDHVAIKEMAVEVSGGWVPQAGTAGPQGVAYSAEVRFECPRGRGCGSYAAFEVPGASASTARRVFLGGILGAAGITLIVEGLLLGETASRKEDPPPDPRDSTPHSGGGVAR
jgi:hypothetical protein